LFAAGVEVVTDRETGKDGHRWFFFTAPVGHFYEMCDHPSPRPPQRSTTSS
jgi:hypothetical protein